MKKAIALVLFAATVFALAACAKKGERYVEPPTEVITFDNGAKVVYEVVTEANGEPQTDEEGQKVYRLYDPPLTEKGGYLVTDAQGSTIKRSAATEASVTANNDSGFGMLDEEDVTIPATDENGRTEAPQTDANGQTVPAATTAVGAAAATTVPTGSSGQTETTTGTSSTDEHASTVAFGDAISQSKAIRLIQLLEGIENPFDEDLVESRYAEAKDSLRVYVSNILKAEKEIMADPEMFAFVTKSNLEYWNYYLTQMQLKYDEFAAIVGAQKPGEKPSPSVYSSYVAFQSEYNKANDVYYGIIVAAEKHV